MYKYVRCVKYVLYTSYIIYMKGRKLRYVFIE